MDSVYSHLAWRESIRDRFGVTIDFPILEDVSTQIARRCEMFHPRHAPNATVRALFVIDPVTRRPLGERGSAAGTGSADRLGIVTPEG